MKFYRPCLIFEETAVEFNYFIFPLYSVARNQTKVKHDLVCVPYALPQVPVINTACNAFILQSHRALLKYIVILGVTHRAALCI